MKAASVDLVTCRKSGKAPREVFGALLPLRAARFGGVSRSRILQRPPGPRRVHTRWNVGKVLEKRVFLSIRSKIYVGQGLGIVQGTCVGVPSH